MVFPSGPGQDGSLLATEEERENKAVQTEVLYELKGSTFCRVLRQAFTLKRDLRCLDTAPREAVPTVVLQRTEEVRSSAPRRAREGQRGQIHIQCVLISKTSSLPQGWKLRCQAGQDK